MVDVTGQPIISSLSMPGPTVNTVDNTSAAQLSSISIPKVVEPLPTAGIIGPDLRKELKLLVDNVGFRWVGLRSVDLTTPCACKAQGFGTTFCTRCMNTGHVYTDYLVKAYTWNALFGVQFEGEIGRISTQSRNCVLQWDRAIKKRDYILELDLDPNTGHPVMPFSVLRYFEIQDSQGILGDGARVEFWKCNLEERSIFIGTDDDPSDRPTDISNTGIS